jgi:hypothetical protein
MVWLAMSDLGGGPLPAEPDDADFLALALADGAFPLAEPDPA